MGEEACCPPVVVVLEPLLDGAEVHRLLDDLEVVRKTQLDCVHGIVEGPGVLVFPHDPHNTVLEDQQLVRVAASAAWGRLDRRLPHPIDRGHLDLGPLGPGVTGGW